MCIVALTRKRELNRMSIQNKTDTETITVKLYKTNIIVLVNTVVV